MKLPSTLIMLFIFLTTMAISSSVHAQHNYAPANPVIQPHGTIYTIDNSVKPDPDITYKIVIDLKTPIADTGKINAGLNNLARMLNLHVAGGISPENIKVVAAIHGGATHVVLDNTGYRQKYGMDNPNLGLISKLREAGVELYVCGQSLIARNDGFENVNEEIKIALSMLTVVTEHMAKGYSLLQFD